MINKGKRKAFTKNSKGNIMQHTNYLNTFIVSNIAELNDISKDFINDYEKQELSYLSDCFHEFANNFCPVYYSEIDNEVTDEMIDNFLSEIGGYTVKDSNDLNNLKMYALTNDYSNTLYEDTVTIKAVLYAKLMLDNPELIEKIDTSDVIQEILISLANDGHDCISLDRLTAEIADWLPDEEEE